MLKITNLTIKNFLSVGNVTQALKLNENGLTLVLGSNTDSNGGLTRNGAGKSTILQAISYALFGKPLTRIKIPNLINNINGRNMLVTIEFEENGTIYKIERGKKTDVMKFYKNSEEQKLDSDETKGENRETQAEIERIIGMSHTMFKHIVALNTFTDPFLKMGAADQRMIIEELLGITQISHRADVLKKLINVTKEAIRNHEARIKATIDANGAIEAAIRQAELKVQAWESSHEARLTDLASELAAMEGTDFDAEIALFDAMEAHDADKRELEAEQSSMLREISFLKERRDNAVSEIARLEADIESGIVAQVQRLENERKRRAAEATRLQPKADALQADILQVGEDLQNADNSNCVCCGQSIAGTDHLMAVRASLEARRTELETEIQHVLADIARAHSDADAVAKEIERVRDEDESRKAAIVDEISTKKPNLRSLCERLEQQELVLENHRKQIANLGPRPQSSFRSRDDIYRARSDREKIERAIEHEMQMTNPHREKIDDFRKTIQVVDYEPLNEQTDLLKHQEFLLKLLTSKDSFIRKKIIDQNLAYLNSRLNHYLDKLGLPHEVIFQSDLTVEITKLGRDFDFEQLSRGEMNRVIMATSFSFRDVWESQNTPTNLFFVDELLDNGLCPHGVESALAILKSLGRDRGKNVFLISHREELQARIDHTLVVEKENDFTTISVV